MMHCVDDLTGKFWRIYAGADGALIASPIEETPRAGDWDLFGPISDLVNGPLTRVPHHLLQAMYDRQGEPARSGQGPHHHTFTGETT